MLKVETTVGTLQVGDRIQADFTDGEEVVTRVYDPTTQTWETDKHNGSGGCWTSSGPDARVYLVASDASQAALRVVVALNRFAPEVRREVVRAFCRTCGGFACAEH